jgi:hypothetical protein
MRRAIQIISAAVALWCAVNLGAAVEQSVQEHNTDAARVAARGALTRDGYSNVEEMGTSCFVSMARDQNGVAVWAWACPNGKKYAEPPKQHLGPDEL